MVKLIAANWPYATGYFSPRFSLAAKIVAVITLFALPISTSAVAVLFPLSVLLAILSGQWRQQWSTITNSAMTLLFIGFLLIHLLAVSYSIADPAEIRYQLIKFSWLLLAPLWIPLFVEPQWRQRGINAFLGAMVLTLALSFAKYFHWINDAHFWYLLSHRATVADTVFKDHIIQGFLMNLAAMLLLYRCIKQRHLGYGCLFSLATFQILFINSARSGYILFFILLVYTLFSQCNFKRALMVGSVCIAALTALLVTVPGPVHQRVKEALTDVEQWHQGHKKTSLGYRMDWQKNALILIKERPFIGYGTGSIRAAYATLNKSDTEKTGIVNNTSNEYLNIMIQFGAFGLLFFLLMIIFQWRYSFFLLGEHRLLIQTLLIALAVGNLANSWLTDFTQGHYYALLTMLTSAALTMRPVPSMVTTAAYSDDAVEDILV